MDRKAWKIVYYDYFSISRGNEYSILYHDSDIINTPKIGKILCFSTAKHLKNFMKACGYGIDSNNSYHILHGMAFNIGNPKNVAKYIIDIRRFWEDKKSKKKISVMTLSAPKGTISCDGFKIERTYSISAFLVLLCQGKVE